MVVGGVCVGGVSGVASGRGGRGAWRWGRTGDWHNVACVERMHYRPTVSFAQRAAQLAGGGVAADRSGWRLLLAEHSRAPDSHLPVR